MRGENPVRDGDYVEYRLVVQGTPGVAERVEEVDYLRTQPVIGAVRGLGGAREEIWLSLDSGVAELAVDESVPGRKLFSMNAARYDDLVRGEELYLRNGKYSLRLSLGK